MKLIWEWDEEAQMLTDTNGNYTIGATGQKWAPFVLSFGRSAVCYETLDRAKERAQEDADDKAKAKVEHDAAVARAVELMRASGRVA